MDDLPADHASRRRSRLSAGIRWLLLLRVPNGTWAPDMRVIDIILLIVLIPVVVIIAIPILVATLAGSYAVAFGLGAIGIPDAIGGAVILVLGVGGGLALLFLVLVRLSRRVPAAVRDLLNDDGAPSEGEPASRRDPLADPSTFTERVTAADASLAPTDPAPTDD